MALRKRHKRNIPRAGPFPPGWDVPAAFNFTRDVVEAYASDPVRLALTFVDREGIVDRRTFVEVAGDAARWAHLLRTRLDRGDRVLVVVGKVPSWHGAMLGAIKGGLVAVPCPPTLRARELAFRVKDTGARLVIADRACEPEIEEMRNQIGDIVTVLYVDEALAELTRYRPAAPTEETTAGETALILYTSGTTTEPKGVVHTHAYTWAQRRQAGAWLGANERDVVWCTAETGWAKAIWNLLLGPWSHGAEVVLHENPFDPEERLSLLQRLGVTVLCQAPTEYRMLAKVDTLATTYLPKLRHTVSTGEPLDPELVARFQDALGLTIHDGYGQTENSLLVANLPGAPIRPGSMGLPTEGHEVAVIDESGNVCAPGVEGDIALMGRPPTLFSGYWNNRDETNAVFRDGWYLTGDRARRDEEGYVWFAGRTDDVILSSAYRIGPVEVESALLEHPAVAESAVVGVPDADRGQIVKAFVVLRPGHEPGDQLAIELQDHVKAITAPYKYPRAISFVDDLPRTTSGKIHRSELRDSEDSLETFSPAAVVVPLRPVSEPEPEDDAAEQARREAEARERARAAAAEADRARVEAEVAARIEAEEEDRARREAEELVRREAEAKARSEADEQARLEAEEAELRRAEAEAAAAARAEAERLEADRIETEAAAAARAEAEAVARAEAERLEAGRLEAERLEAERLEAEAAARAGAARLEAEEAARREAEAATRAEAEAALEREREEQARLAEEEAEQVRLEAEEAERTRLAAEAVAREEAEALAREEAEAVAREEKERAWREAKERQWRAAQEQAALRQAEAAAAERARAVEDEPDEAPGDDWVAEHEALAVETAEEGSESWREARRRKRDEAARAKAEAEESKRRAKADAERQKEEAAAAREDAKRRAEEEKEAAKRRAEEEKLAAKQRAEDERRQAKEAEEQRKRDEADAREQARQREVEEREAAKRVHAAAKPKRGLFGGHDEDDDPFDEGSVEPIPGIVERLQRYSGAVDPHTVENGAASYRDDLLRDGHVVEREAEPEHVDERRSLP